MRRAFDTREVARLAGLSESQVRYWHRSGLVPGAVKDNGRLCFDFRALAAFRTVRGLLDRGVSLRRLRKAMRTFRRLVAAEEDLPALHVSLEGEEIVFTRDEGRVTPHGQLLLDFSSDFAEPVPLAGSAPGLFFEALEREEQGDPDSAAERYRTLLERDPTHADAWVNLGNIHVESGETAESERCYRRALEAEPDHPEANFNLANLWEEQDRVEDAVLLYRRALREAPEFADAHFNLARALERLGRIDAARPHWQDYLELDPGSQDAAYARGRLRAR